LAWRPRRPRRLRTLVRRPLRIGLAWRSWRPRRPLVWPPPFWFGLPLWWDSYSAWGWPYQYYGYLGTYGYPDYGVATVPADPGTAAPGPSDTAELEPSEGAPAVTGPAPVELDVAPTGALVYLNGALIGSVNEFSGRPDYLYLDPGQYALEFRLPGYRTRTLPLTARGSGKILIALDLRAEAAGGGATGAPPSPGLPHGRRFGPSFGRESTPAQTPPGSPGNDQPASGATSASTALVLRISPPSAAVYVDGVLLGTGESLGRLPQGVAVSPGKHRVDVVAPGHAGKTVQADAEAGTTKELAISLE